MPTLQFVIPDFASFSHITTGMLEDKNISVNSLLYLLIYNELLLYLLVHTTIFYILIFIFLVYIGPYFVLRTGASKSRVRPWVMEHIAYCPLQRDTPRTVPKVCPSRTSLSSKGTLYTMLAMLKRALVTERQNGRGGFTFSLP